MKLFLIFVLMSLGQTASAASVKLTFDEFDCGMEYADSGRSGSISYTNPNQDRYGNCGQIILLGDDGWEDNAAIRADKGTVFDVKSFQVWSNYGISRFPRSALNTGYNPALDPGFHFYQIRDWKVGPYDELKYAAVAEVTESFNYFEILGYRDGLLVAQESFDPSRNGAGWMTYEPGANFSNLTDLVLRVTMYGGYISQSIYFDDDYLYGCIGDFFRCGNAMYDNVVLETRTAFVAPVPLPAAGMLMGFGLLTLWSLRRSKRGLK